MCCKHKYRCKCETGRVFVQPSSVNSAHLLWPEPYHTTDAHISIFLIKQFAKNLRKQFLSCDWALTEKECWRGFLGSDASLFQADPFGCGVPYFTSQNFSFRSQNFSSLDVSERRSRRTSGNAQVGVQPLTVRICCLLLTVTSQSEYYLLHFLYKFCR